MPPCSVAGSAQSSSPARDAVCRYHRLVGAEIIGLIPAAGAGRRLPARVTSKEILPLPSHLCVEGQEVVADHLLRRFAVASIRRALLLLRPGKDDIREGLGPNRLGVGLTYVDVGTTGSIVETLCRARSEIGDRIVALGFPDVLFEPEDAYRPLLDRLDGGGADAVLGLFPVTDPERSDIVEVDADGLVRSIRVKDRDAGSGYGWMIAAWRPVVSRFLERWWSGEAAKASIRELYPGDMLQAAAKEGLRVDTVRFPGGVCLDIGTPEGLAAASEFGASGGVTAAVDDGTVDS